MNEKIFTSKEELENKLLSISNRLVMTKGEYRFPPHCSVEDLDWNHMDWAHRPTIHNTYNNSVRLHAEPNFALSVTNQKFLGLNVFVQVSDVKIKTGFFYQCYTVLGLIYIHGVLENSSETTCFSWYILSPWWLKPLHGVLSRKLYNLNHVQIAEDVPLRKRRKELRDNGYTFPPEDRDYVTSNDGRMHTVYPKISGSLQKDLTGMKDGECLDFQIENSPFFVQLKNSNEVLLWPKVCPHEGGPLEISNKCANGAIVCPWHDLQFKPVVVSINPVHCYGGKFQFENGILFINRI